MSSIVGLHETCRTMTEDYQGISGSDDSSDSSPIATVLVGGLLEIVGIAIEEVVQDWLAKRAAKKAQREEKTTI